MTAECGVEANVVDWSSIRDEVFGACPALKEMFGAGNIRVPKFKVVQISAAYGVALIKNGQINWKVFPDEGAPLRAQYAYRPIPLGLVLDKTIELYTIPSAEDSPTWSPRTVPLYLLKKGELFGLFETLLDNFLARDQHGSAGMKSLLLLPSIGNFGRREAFVRRNNMHLADGLSQHLKHEEKSRCEFGEFFAELARSAKVDWKCRFILFSKDFVEKILATNYRLRDALRGYALRQLQVAYERELTIREVSRLHGSRDNADSIAIRLVGHGLRPGFVPVFLSKGDEDFLPAASLNRLMLPDELSDRPFPIDKVDEPPSPADKKADYFPMLLRPSQDSNCLLYFLRRPYMPQMLAGAKTDQMNIEGRIKAIIEAANLAEKERSKRNGGMPSPLFRAVLPERFETEMERRATEELIERKVVAKSTYFFAEGGAISIERKAKSGE
jgi:hypothetical protein